MNLYLHQTHQQIGDFQTAKEYLQQVLRDTRRGLHLFPELSLSGYPLKDLCLQQGFIHAYLELLEELECWCQALPARPEQGVLVGGPSYLLEDGRPVRIENAIFFLSPGEGLKQVYAKRALPSYDIFDEQKYFTPGRQGPFWSFCDKSIALLICEDAWPTEGHSPQSAPWEELSEKPVDLVINFSASPFAMGKPQKRKELGHQLSNYLGAPVAMVNRVGGEDELLFDGNSFVVSGDEVLAQGASWREDLLECPWPPSPVAQGARPTTWSPFPAPALEQGSPPQLRPLNQKQLEELTEAMTFGLSEYAAKCGLNKFLVGLSGGVDSALVLSLAKLAGVGEVEAIFCPDCTAPRRAGS